MRAELNGTLQIRAEERVVHGHGEVSFVGDPGDSRDVADDHGGIGGRLHVDHSGVGAQRFPHTVEIGGVHEREFHSELAKELRRQAVDAAVYCP